jgi:hypothetical protein
MKEIIVKLFEYSEFLEEFLDLRRRPLNCRGIARGQGSFLKSEVDSGSPQILASHSLNKGNLFPRIGLEVANNDDLIANHVYKSVQAQRDLPGVE